MMQASRWVTLTIVLPTNPYLWIDLGAVDHPHHRFHQVTIMP